VTRREVVLGALRASGSFRSAQQLYAAIRAEGERIGLATVYRTLTSLAAQGEVDSLLTQDGEALYRLCRSGSHHHHLSCRSCGQAVELDADVVEQWARQVGERYGFVAVEHVVELVGTCRQCAGQPPPSGTPGSAESSTAAP
jgi:Fur family transcriptional regulator, ferric uptake regulator